MKTIMDMKGTEGDGRKLLQKLILPSGSGECRERRRLRVCHGRQIVTRAAMRWGRRGLSLWGEDWLVHQTGTQYHNSDCKSER
jgi:hypothetical protein